MWGSNLLLLVYNNEIAKKFGIEKSIVLFIKVVRLWEFFVSKTRDFIYLFIYFLLLIFF